MEYAIGIDLGGTSIKYALVDKAGNSFFEGKLPSFASVSAAKVIEQLIKAVMLLKDEAAKQNWTVLGIGLGTPGIVDETNRIVLGGAENIIGWENIDVASLLEEQMKLSGIAVDAVMDSVSVKTTFREKLAELGVIFCSFSEAVQHHPDLVQKYLGSVVGYRDNFFAALNSAVFSDGSFVYIPKGVRCPMELSTYFRINAANTGQFERTLIVADDEAYVSYLEGCTAPMRDENQLHAAIVEIVAHERAEVKYSTVQNWYPGDKDGKGGIYNFVTKRGLCKGEGSKISWTQVETGSAITWKYPSCILAGDNSVGEFYSVAVTNNYQQADTGTKMIHLGRNTRSTIVSKGISAGHSQNSYRGLVKVSPRAEGARNHSQCDSLLLSSTCGAHTFPYADIQNETAVVEHEATTSKISEEQLFYCRQRGISVEEAVGLIVNGYAREVMNKLPMEFAVEAQKLLTISLEGSVG